MNELLFFLHIATTMVFVLLSSRFGKGGLIAFVALQGILANLFVVKQMPLFGFVVTCSDVFIVGSIFALNLLQEFFGKDAAKRAIHISFVAALFFACMSQIHLLYAPAREDVTHGSFAVIFSHTPRIMIASIATFFLVQRWDVFFFGWLQRFMPSLTWRMGVSMVVSQLLDTVLFSFLGLYGFVTSIFDIIIVSFCIKCLIIGLSAPLSAFSKRFVKHVSL